MDNKRKEERISKSVKSEVRTDESMTYSSTVDLSKSGIFISTPEPLSEGAEINLSFTLPEGNSVDMKGVVRWIREDGDDSKKAGMGIEFIGSSPDQISAINRIIK